MGRKTLAALVLLVMSPLCLGAQTSRFDPTDTQARFATQLKLNLPRKWEVSLGYEGRWVDNASIYHGSYYDAEVAHPVGRYLTLFSNYRYADVPDAVTRRYGFGGEVERKMKHYSLAFRSMFQYQAAAIDEAEQGSSQALRTRFRMKVPAGKRASFYGSAEPYFAFTGVYPVDNWRNTVGMQWEFMKSRKIDLYYIYRPDYAKEYYNRTFHIIGAELSAELKIPRAKPKKGKG